MPKAPRSVKGQGIYRSTPVSIASAPTASSYHHFVKPEIPESIMQSSQQYPMNGGPVQPLHYLPPVQQRSSSSAWTPQNDEILLSARAKGMNWQPIQAQFFQDKTANACRKRHERLMLARNSNEDWDSPKMKELAEQYMGMRERMWKPIADQLGVKWTTVESKCMQQGIKNLNSLARARNRERKLHEDGQAVAVQEVSHVQHGHTRHPSGQLPHPVLGHYTHRNSVSRYDDRDDSGISVFDDGDTGYSPNGDQSFRHSGDYDTMTRSEEHWSIRDMQPRTLNVMQPAPVQQPYGRLDSRMDPRYAMPSPGIPSTDMRIPALINGHGHESGMRRGHDPVNGMNGHVNGNMNGMGGSRQVNGGRN